MEMILSSDKDLRILLNKVMDVSDFLFQRYLSAKENYPLMEENENKLNRREENGKNHLLILEIEHIYLNQQVDSNNNSEYGPDDDLDADLQVFIINL